MSTKSEASKTSRDSKASKYGSTPTEPTGFAEEVNEAVPQSEVPGRVVMTNHEEKSEEPVMEFDLGNGMKFSWKTDGSGGLKPSSKECRHVLQANGGVIANCYSSTLLSTLLSETALSTFWGSRSLKRILCL